MAEDKARALGTIEGARQGRARRGESRAAAPSAPAAQPLDPDFERRRALRLQLEQTYSVHNGVYADPARPTVPLFVAERRRIVAYDIREPTIRAMLDLAQANRWNAIKVTGDKEFQRRGGVQAPAPALGGAPYTHHPLPPPPPPSPRHFYIR